MKHRFRNATVYTALYLLLIVASVDTAAHFLMNHLSHLGTTSTALVNDVTQREQTIIPLAIDQFTKNADAKTKQNIEENRAKIDAAVADLLKNPQFRAELAKILEPVGTALTSGQSSVSIETKPLAGMIAAEINSIAGKKVISTSDVAKMSKPQTIDLAKPSKVVHNVNSITTGLLWLWIPIFLLIALVFRLRRRSAFSTLGKIFLTLAVPILVIWYLIPSIAQRIIDSKADSKLPATLFPIVYREVTGFTQILGIVYLALAVISILIGLTVRRKSKHSLATTEPAAPTE
jgi:hypothetical protein